MLELTPIGALLCVFVMAVVLIIEGVMAFSLLLEILARRYGDEVADNRYMTADVDALAIASLAIGRESVERQ